jgi:hypothetical protein
MSIVKGKRLGENLRCVSLFQIRVGLTVCVAFRIIITKCKALQFDTRIRCLRSSWWALFCCYYTALFRVKWNIVFVPSIHRIKRFCSDYRRKSIRLFLIFKIDRLLSYKTMDNIVFKIISSNNSLFIRNRLFAKFKSSKIKYI